MSGVTSKGAPDKAGFRMHLLREDGSLHSVDPVELVQATAAEPTLCVNVVLRREA
jgi:hypothetical protein